MAADHSIYTPRMIKPEYINGLIYGYILGWPPSRIALSRHTDTPVHRCVAAHHLTRGMMVISSMVKADGQTKDIDPINTVRSDGVDLTNTTHVSAVIPTSTTHSDGVEPINTTHTNEIASISTTCIDGVESASTANSNEIAPNSTTHTDVAIPAGTIHTDDAALSSVNLAQSMRGTDVPPHSSPRVTTADGPSEAAITPTEHINAPSKGLEAIKKKLHASREWHAAVAAWDSSTMGNTLYSTADCMYLTLMSGACESTAQCESAVVTLCVLADTDLLCIASCVLQSVVVFYLMRGTPNSPQDVDIILDTAVRVAIKYLTDEPFPTRTDDGSSTVWRPADQRTQEFTRRIYTAYTERLCDIHASLADAEPSITCISYTVYMLQIMRMAAKTRSRINLEKVFTRIGEQLGDRFVDYPLLGAIVGSYTGATYLRARYHKEISELLGDATPSDWSRVYSTLNRFMGDIYGPDQ